MRRIIVLASDLFVQSRILEAARQHKLTAQVVADPNVKRLSGLDSSDLVVLDLASTDYDPFQIARDLKGSSSPPRIFGFYPHVRQDLKRNAEESRIDHVVTNHDLLPSLARVLKLETTENPGRP